MKRAALFALTFLIALPAAAQVYQWKDKDGKTHYTDVPPPSGEVKTVIQGKPAATVIRNAPEVDEPPFLDSLTPGTAQPGANKPTTPAITVPEKSRAERDLEERERRAKAAEAETKAAQDAAREEKRARECERARTQLAALSSGQRLARPTADGGRVIIDDKMRIEEISRAQESVDAFCK
jgi:hypothetical protein